MFKDILQRLVSANPAPMPPEDCRLALTALMVRVAKADDRFETVEHEAISDILGTRFGLDPDGIAEVLAEAERLEAEAGDTVRLTRMIKDAVPYEDRLAVVEALWQVALADGKRSDDENALLRLVVSLIGITDQESGLARRRVAAQRA